MFKTFLSFVLSFVILKGLSLLIPAIVVGNIFSVAIFLIVLALINFLLKPILQFFGIIINLLTLGLFSILINIFCFALAIQITDAVVINASGIMWFLGLFLVSTAVSLAGSIAESLTLSFQNRD